MTKRRILALFIGALMAPSLLLAQQLPQPPLRTTKLTTGIHVITAELATTPQSRMIGLMMRERLAPNHGMVFMFDDKSQHCFWMRNTLIPLSIAFIEDDGTIVAIADMAPKSEASTCPPRAVRYALEMDQGWFTKRGITAGMKITGLPPR
ncbi:MAG: DUF192 domain-containing protein [Candidatus Obscuribacterales bacterium]|nr:DUF192 domain-containing protein [Steroidobacteraceae bacterium]